MAKCLACGKFISPAGAASCTKCSGLFHKPCVSISEMSPVGKGWSCPECTPRTKRNDSTPLRSAATADAASTATDVAAKQCTGDASESSAALVHDLQAMHQEFSEWMREMRAFRQEMTEIRASLLGLSTRMDNFERRLEAVEQERRSPPPELASLQCKVAILQQEINDRDQDALLSDIEIGHLPEEKGENLVHTVTVLATKLGVPLLDQDIVYAERVGVAQGAGAGGEAPRARRVVVRLARRHLRDQLLHSARVRRSLSAVDAGRDPSAIAGATAPPLALRARIFLNERLTKVNRLLFHRAREECRRHQWKYSWTKRGRVYVRQAEGKQSHLIRSEEDVERVFGSN